MNKEVKKLVENSRSSLDFLNKKSNKKINSIIKLIEKEILNKEVNYKLSEMAVKETGFGNIKDKIYKNKYKTKNLIKEIIKIKTNKPIYNNSKKIYEIIKPIGLICGVTPSTNPVATALNYIINSIKCRNSIIICPNPRSYKVSQYLINKIKEVFLKNKIPEEIVNIVPESIIRGDEVINLFNLCDKNIVTGNKNFISKVKKSIKPFLTFGVGNVPVIVNKDADLSYAASSISKSKSFDNSTSCSADSVAIVHQKVYNSFVKKLVSNGFYFLDEKSKKNLEEIYLTKNFVNPRLIGKNAKTILKHININIKKVKIIIYEKKFFDKNHFIFNEKILPLMGLIPFKSISEAIKIAQNILKINGLGHSAGIYSKNKKDILEISKSLDVSRLIINQEHSQSAGGSVNNSLNTTLSLGCGAWGNNQINHNLNYLDFSNKTLVILRKK
tara:strand:+ start:4485 stop:5810 length:1326 start_codon:yes stop_codon:yes gene_type:complete